MKMKTVCVQIAAAIAITAMVGFTAPARASVLTWNWSWSDQSNNTGSGTLTTNALSNGSYLITAMSGTWDGNSISGLLPCCASGNDNLLLAGSPQLDAYGVAFASGSNEIDLFYSGGQYGNVMVDAGFARPVTGTFSAALVSASEPGTLVLLAAGLAALGFAVSRRKLRIDA